MRVHQIMRSARIDGDGVDRYAHPRCAQAMTGVRAGACRRIAEDNQLLASSHTAILCGIFNLIPGLANDWSQT